MTEVIDTADPVLSYACGYNSHDTIWQTVTYVPVHSSFKQ